VAYGINPVYLNFEPYFHLLLPFVYGNIFEWSNLSFVE
jgi:hypothetical protein